MENKNIGTENYAVIPASVRYCKGLNPNAKLLYGEISALSSKDGYCTSSNEYFSDLYSVSKTSISLWIKALTDNEFIRCEIEKNYKRKIFTTNIKENK
jgi:SOS-response transcriptional repressor LexA